MIRHKFLFPFLFLFSILTSGGLHANQSTIDGDVLLIPRVDVEGFGPLQISFHIVYQGEYFFDVADHNLEQRLC